MHPNSIPPADHKEAKRQANRVYMSGLVIVSLTVEAAQLGLFALAGTIPAWPAVLFLAVALATSSAVYAFMKLGFNRRFRDKGMLVPQLIINGLLQLVFLALVPKLAVLFLLFLFAMMSTYAVIGFTPRQFVSSWLVFGVGTAVGVWLIRDSYGYPGVSPPEIFLVWLFFFLILGSSMLASVRVSALRERLSEKNRLLNESLLQIEELASRDHLTGVLNRRRFMELLEMEWQRVERGGQAFCFAILDLDHFKSINDTYGHLTGDAVLKTTCEIIVQSIRQIDLVGRLGGEEFAILLPATSLGNGTAVMERLRTSVNEYDWESITPGLKVSFCGGISAPKAGDTLQSIAMHADEALYRAKRDGRNRVVAADPAQSIFAMGKYGGILD